MHYAIIDESGRFSDPLLNAALDIPFFIEHLDSQRNPIVSVADFVAGAIREDYVNSNSIWKKIIQGKITKETKISWKQLRSTKKGKV